MTNNAARQVCKKKTSWNARAYTFIIIARPRTAVTLWSEIARVSVPYSYVTGYSSCL